MEELNKINEELNILQNKKLKILEKMTHAEKIKTEIIEKIESKRVQLEKLIDKLNHITYVYDWLIKIKFNSKEIRKQISLRCTFEEGDNYDPITYMELVFDELKSFSECRCSLEDYDIVEEKIEKLISGIKYWHDHKYKDIKADIEEKIEKIKAEIQALKEQLK